jgi:hypothetical protein
LNLVGFIPFVFDFTSTQSGFTFGIPSSVGLPSAFHPRLRPLASGFVLLASPNTSKGSSLAEKREVPPVQQG